MIDLDATFLPNSTLHPSERHDCNMWETPHTTPLSTIHKGEIPDRSRKMTLQALFETATKKSAAFL